MVSGYFGGQRVRLTCAIKNGADAFVPAPFFKSTVPVQMRSASSLQTGENAILLEGFALAAGRDGLQSSPNSLHSVVRPIPSRWAALL